MYMMLSNYLQVAMWSALIALNFLEAFYMN